MPIPRTDDDGNREGFWRRDQVIQPGDVIPDSKSRGAEHLSALHEPHLQEIAHQVGFGYARLSSTDSIARAMLDRRFARRTQAPTDLYWIPALMHCCCWPSGSRLSFPMAKSDTEGAPMAPVDEDRR